ncbi:anaerobic ribonucleoside-triphosphate reductase activating protein [Pseudomonadota bacterium AL_CKDN230030165-1A_HGKHYDSX7]
MSAASSPNSAADPPAAAAALATYGAATRRAARDRMSIAPSCRSAAPTRPEAPVTVHRVIAPPAPLPQPLARDAPAVGGLTPFSTVDWPGTLAAVVFISGCPWRCHYCHNAELQQRAAHYAWDEVRAFLATRRGLLDGVVFSGGEPLSEPCLDALADETRALGFRLGLHTAGIYPRRFAALLPQLDWVGLDIKADEAGYDGITGRRGSARPAQDCLAQLLASDTAFECRITWHPDWLDETRLLALATLLSRRGVRQFVVQNARSDAAHRPASRLSVAAEAALLSMFDFFCVR